MITPVRLRTKMKMNTVWIVEMMNAKRRTWEPTTGCALSRHDSRLELSLWREANPCDRFRLRRYSVSQ